MKLLQLNMWMGRLTQQILALLDAEKPDIITAQEVFSTDSPILFPDRMFDIYEQIKESGYPHTYFTPTFTMDVNKQIVRFGNAVFSKLPFTSTETIWTHLAYQGDMSEPNFEPNARNAQIVTVDIAGRPVNIINHHGYWEPDPLGSLTTIAAMQIVADKAKRLTGPVILAGDLNVGIDSPAMRLFDGTLDDLIARYDIQDTLSQFGKVHGIACDHVLISPQIQPRAFQVLNELVSDHQGIVLEFELAHEA